MLPVTLVNSADPTVVLLGDHRQLGPVVGSRHEGIARYDYAPFATTITTTGCLLRSMGRIRVGVVANRNSPAMLSPPSPSPAPV